MDGRPATLIGNIVQSNEALAGGGLSLSADATLTGNIVRSNVAWHGGGLFIVADATLTNDVIADNRLNSSEGVGSGVFVLYSSLHLRHTTIARNSGGDGSGVHVASSFSTVMMSNTIIFSHTVGVTVATGNTATLNATLWHANDSKTGGAGTINTTNDHDGDPAFDTDGYHLTGASAAIDQGVDAGVNFDIDGDSRPMGSGFDIGADEFSPHYENYLPLILKNYQP